MKRYFILFGIFSVCLLFFNNALADKRGFVNTVVIDAGHGGKDPGALGSRSQEKDIALTITLKVGEYINKYLPDVKVIYTRDEDVFVPLHERASIANNNNADLFISIHCNASPSPKAIGTETFVMGLDRSKANLEVAKLENAAILYEEDYMDTYGGYDPHSPESVIIFALYQNTNLNQSIEVASKIQNQFRERVGRIDRGVKQGPFLVLWRVTMPSILIEVGFINNPIEEEFLMSESGQNYIASAIFRAFRDYKQLQDGIALKALKNQKTEETADSNPNNFSNNVSETSVADKTVNISHNNKSQTSTTQLSSSNEILFKVQFAAAQQKRPLDSPDFNSLKDVDYYFHEGLYKYTVGKVKTLQDAIVIQAQMQEAGYNDAFVVAFYNNERISASEALKLLQVEN